MPNLVNPMVPQELLVVGAAMQSGIFDQLHESNYTIDELAIKLSLDFRALWTVIEALTALGYVNESEGRLYLTAETEDLFYNENSKNYVGHAIIHTFNVIKSWTRIPEILKTGIPPERERTKQDIKGFMAAMKKNAKEVAEEIVGLCLKNMPSSPSVLDLGGGPLNYARPFAKAGAIVTVQDISDVCAVMEPTLEPGEKLALLQKILLKV
ncbi:hypothetical protein N752_08385 [Desulforamulus aquiferis]|nr:hypothetical protein [Desulforamulus aquiferis]RYD05605.1 hypothetical protein N752_08385 [Desulforamulus aquiferis]